MKWEDILKVDINMRDARRLGTDYSIRDMYEGKLVSQEEYDLMTDEERRNYHGRISNYSKIPERKRADTLLDIEREKEAQRRIDTRMNMRDGQTENRREREKQKKRRNVIPSLIVDYFTMYRNRGLGMPTVEDIAREEGRQLTVEEIEGYRKYRAGFER